MGTSAFKIDTKAIKNPTEYSTSGYLLTTLERLANGDMAGDLIARKRKFFFTYAAITSSEYRILWEALYLSNQLFHSLSFYDDVMKENVTATVYVGEMPRDLHHAYGDEWVWENVKFNLIEK